MPEISLFTWNVHYKDAAYRLAVDHLSVLATKQLFVACLQELPSESEILQARREPQPALSSRQIGVVPVKGRLPQGLALAHHSDLELVEDAIVDADEEFIAAVLRVPSSRTVFGIVGVHAKSKTNLDAPEDWGGTRALLRHAINSLRLEDKCEHVVVLGDFNSHYDAREMRSRYCFYALSGHGSPVVGSETRGGLKHSALRVVSIRNAATSTYAWKRPSVDEPTIVDFIVVTESAHVGAEAVVLTEVAGTPICDPRDYRPSISDHLPVEGMIRI